MKSFGNLLLLTIVHVLILFIGSGVTAAVFAFLMQTDFGYSFVGHLTGGMPDVAATLVSCVISFFFCQQIAERINAHKSLWWLGILIILSNLIFGLLNLAAGSGIAANIVQGIYGIFIASSSKEQF